MGSGEIVALAGENGSKSTLAKILAGSVTRDAGTVQVLGVEANYASPRAALADGVALVAQEPTAVPGMSVAENVLLTQLPAPLGAFRRRAYNERAHVILERVGVFVSPEVPLSTLQAGDRELVEIAKRWRRSRAS